MHRRKLGRQPRPRLRVCHPAHELVARSRARRRPARAASRLRLPRPRRPSRIARRPRLEVRGLGRGLDHRAEIAERHRFVVDLDLAELVQLGTKCRNRNFSRSTPGCSLWTFFDGLYGHVRQTFHTMTVVRDIAPERVALKPVGRRPRLLRLKEKTKGNARNADDERPSVRRRSDDGRPSLPLLCLAPVPPARRRKTAPCHHRAQGRRRLSGDGGARRFRRQAESSSSCPRSRTSHCAARLLAGELDSDERRGGDRILAAARNGDIKIVGCHWQTVVHSVSGRAEVKGPQDFKGNTMAISAPNATPDMIGRAYLAQNNVPASEVKSRRSATTPSASRPCRRHCGGDRDLDRVPSDRRARRDQAARARQRHDAEVPAALHGDDGQADRGAAQRRYSAS